MCLGIPVALLSHRSPSLAEQLSSTPQPRGQLLPSLAKPAAKPSHASKLKPSPESFSPEISMQKLERNFARLSTSISSSLTREVSVGGQLLNFCVPEPCVVPSKVNRYLWPEGVSWSPHSTSGITQARHRSCNYTKFPAEMREHILYLIVLPIRSSHVSPNSLTLSNFAVESL